MKILSFEQKTDALRRPKRLGWGLTIALFSLFNTTTYNHSEVFKQVDKDGRVIYTDQPTHAADPYEIRDANTMPAAKLPAPSEPKEENTSSSDEAKAIRYSSLRISSPEHDSLIHHGGGNFSVSIVSQPPLAKGHRIKLKLDGQAYKTSKSGSFQLSNINRGSHTLQANILSEDGRSLLSSKVITVHLQRPSAYKR